MKIREITSWCLDRVIETPVFEMAYNRKKAMDIVTAQANPIASHLIYVLLYPGVQTQDHWRPELNKFLRIVNKVRLKPSGKKLSSSDYFALLFTEPLELDVQVQDYVDEAISDRGAIAQPVSIPRLKARLRQILAEISVDLAGQDTAGNPRALKPVSAYIGV